MTQPEYDQQKRECWEEYLSEHKTTYTRTAFDYAFDRAYSLGREKESITQDEIEKAAKDYAYYRSESIKRAEIQQRGAVSDSI